MECDFCQDPMISKMIIASSQLGCSEEIITIAAVLSVQVKLFALVMTNFVLERSWQLSCWGWEYKMKAIWTNKRNKLKVDVMIEQLTLVSVYLCIQSIWISGRGIQKDSDEAKLRFAAAEVYFRLIVLLSLSSLTQCHTLSPLYL